MPDSISITTLRSASVEDKVLYCDTDSLTYVKPLNAPYIPMGNHLGDMCREYAYRHLIEFICAGPKNKGVRHTALDGTDMQDELKIRSFKLTYDARKTLTFDRIRQLIINKYAR